MTTPFSPANRRTVMLLYRDSLTLARNWIAKRDHFRQHALQIRQQFDQHRDVANPREVSLLIEAAKSKLVELRHPDPYIPPTRPGGTKFERYVAPVLDEPIDAHY